MSKTQFSLWVLLTCIHEKSRDKLKKPKVDPHMANFNRTNDAFCWRMLSFQFPFENLHLKLWWKKIVIVNRVGRSAVMAVKFKACVRYFFIKFLFFSKW